MSNKPIVHAPIATGSTEPRDIRDRFADMPNVKDFGAVGDGTTDDTAAFTAAQNSGATAVMVPKGTYNITQDVSGTFYSFGYVDVVGGGNVEIIDVLALDSVPVGTVLWLSTSTVPAGYLLCNGSAVGRVTYPELFAAIGTTYGAGDESTTFNLPNLIDKFAEGGTVAGTVKAAGIPNIISYFNCQGTADPDIIGNKSHLASNYVFTTAELGHVDGGISNSAKYQTTVKMDLSKANSIYGNSDTVQPPALTLLPCIKAFSSVVGDATVVAGQLVNDIQSKVALDGSNVSSIGTALADYIAKVPFPSNTRIAISIPATDTDTAAMPYTGWLRFHARNNTNSAVDIMLQNPNGWLTVSSFTTVYNWEMNCILPVVKGDKIRVYYGNTKDRELWLHPCVNS